MIKSYFDLKEFLNKIDGIFSNNNNYKKIRSEICLYSLGKFNPAAAKDFLTNDYFTEIVGTKSIEFSSNNLKNELINQINDYFLLHIGAKKEELKEFRNILGLKKINLKNKEYFYICGDSITGENKTEYNDSNSQLAEEGLKLFNVDLSTIEHIDLYILCRNLLTYFGNLQSIRYHYTEKYKDNFRKNGYMIINNFLDTEELKALRVATYQIAESAKERNEAYLYGEGLRAQRIYNLIGKSHIYRDFLLNERIREILESEFDRNTLHSRYYLSSFQANILYPGAKAQVLHTDLAIPEPLPPWLIRINVNLLLDDFTEENGASVVIPGSHKYLHKPQPDLINNKMVKLIAPAGSLIVWTGHLWHKSGENNSVSPRAALLACFAASHFREIAVEENYLLINHDILSSFDPKIYELIGGNHGIKKGNF